MSYKLNASANRDALFGGGGGDGGEKRKKKKKTTSDQRDQVSAERTNKKSTTTTSAGYKKSKKKITTNVGLTGDAKDSKLKEAEGYRDKAKKAMQTGIFSRPDPLTASTYYKRTADAYQQCNEFRLERLYRIQSADCQMATGAYATAASEYVRAAELIESANDETTAAKREIGRKCFLNASEAWLNTNEPGKAANLKVSAAMALNWGDESNALSKSALVALEESIEAHVPDPLNPYARYRQTGVSAYVNPDSDETAENPSAETVAFAENHIVSMPYAHESVQEVVYLLVSFGEYPSALYAQGAVSTILSRDGISSLTLSRSFLTETILTLATGDCIAAEQEFLNRHVQRTSYLSSRECKVGEEIFRAVKTRDVDALDEARSTSGSNRAGISNLHQSLRELLSMIRISGVARKATKASSSKKSGKKSTSGASKKKQEEAISFDELSKMKTGYEKDVEAADNIDAIALQDELAALDFGIGNDDDSDMDDDDIDLR